MSQSESTKPRDRREKRDKSVAHFWRATRYLAPHRRLVIVSIACAFLVGLTFTGGLGTMLPILRVLMSGETVQVWAGRIVASERLGAKLADSSEKVLVDHVGHKGAAATAGLKQGDVLVAGADAKPEQTLAAISEPAATAANLTVQRPGQAATAVSVPLAPLK